MGTITLSGDIVSGDLQRVFADSIVLDGKIDSQSLVVIESTQGSVTVTGKIDGHSIVTLKAMTDVAIGAKGGDEDKKIDGSSQVSVVAGGDVVLGSYVHNASVEFMAHGAISLSEIDWGAAVSLMADGDITIAGQINGNEFDHAPSRLEAMSTRGSIVVGAKIDGQSNVSLTAGLDISIGRAPSIGDDERDITGNSFVAAIAGRNIALGGKISGNQTQADFAAAGSITIDKTIEAGALARLLSVAGTLTVSGGITDASCQVQSWPAKPAPAAANTLASVPANPWAALAPLAPTPPRDGYWWRNWPQTFGYVAPFRVVPRSLEDLIKAVMGSGNVDRPDTTPVKAVGGGWSFTDAALPFTTPAQVRQASLLASGAWRTRDVRGVLQGVNDIQFTPMDLLPPAVGRNVEFSTAYDQGMLRQVTSSGIQLPASQPVRLIDTRSLASSLQSTFYQIRVGGEPPDPLPPGAEILFHVEAGITVADLQQLLDHQGPPLALFTSGGSPGATLAGTLSTATHGGEFKSPLLADCVRAIHLIGPGGQQWWIEGDIPVADESSLQTRYGKFGGIHVINAGWSGIPGLTAQDVLKAAAVSMGTMGVIYSVVLAVRTQFGLRQIVHPTSWRDLLNAAKVTEADLRAGAAAANQAVLEALMDGAVNGTGVAMVDNVYVDLAINPFKNVAGSHDCWVVNRQETAAVPDDDNSPAAGVGDYLTALSRALDAASRDTVAYNKAAGRVFDFLSWGTDIVPNIVQDANQAGRLAGYITGQGDVSAAALAVASVQTVANVVNAASEPDRGHAFLADTLSGIFHALQGTKVEGNSDRTAVAYEVGAIGWPDSGLPGRGIEVTLSAANAFSFLQTELLDTVFGTVMEGQNKPVLGYISIRVCPMTETLMGMQQFGRTPVMIEVVAYRSPQANAAMDLVQSRALAWSAAGPRPLLHWGLENDQLSAAYLASTPLGQPFKTGFTRLDAFRQIRAYLKGKNPPVFDNTFTARLGL